MASTGWKLDTRVTEITLGNTMSRRDRPSAKIPLELPVRDCWVLAGGWVDPAAFFALLSEHLPESSTVFLEGTSIDEAVTTALQQFAEPGKYLPSTQTVWPSPAQFGYTFSRDLCWKLSELADNYATPELFDHLFLYVQGSALLEWPDAFATSNTMWVSALITEERVAAFANQLGLHVEFERVT